MACQNSFNTFLTEKRTCTNNFYFVWETKNYLREAQNHLKHFFSMIARPRGLAGTVWFLFIFSFSSSASDDSGTALLSPFHLKVCFGIWNELNSSIIYTADFLRSKGSMSCVVMFTVFTECRSTHLQSIVSLNTP